MHYVSKIEESSARTPKLYEQHSTGFRRATYVDRAMGSVPRIAMPTEVDGGLTSRR